MKKTVDPTRTESGILHQWSYVIIPMEGVNKPLFAAYCRSCDSYVTKWLSTPNFESIQLDKVGVPKIGCVTNYGLT